MTEARTYQCPVCGGFAREGERACRSCQSALATLPCQHCFELNYPSSLHCCGCGHELDADAPAGEAGSRSCPDCAAPLTHVKSPSGTVDACEKCGVQFVSHALLRDLLAQTAALGQAALSLGAARPRRIALAESVHYRPCPVCRTLMNRKNFGGQSGIIVDVCTRHGSLFDPGELPSVLDFARRGGLLRAEIRERERADARRKLDSSSRAELAMFEPAAFTAAGSARSAAEAAEAAEAWVLDLFRFIAELLRRA